MRLSKLKLAGFKSFVDPTVVLTPGQLVGIVGPNGCGKSNLIDAVRWVLGESRASALRGESMQDVIFNGSHARKAVSRASVELVFDNHEGRAAGQWAAYAEIAVKRVVTREGDSDYFINNVRVRRKDVIDLFLGTGLGPRAYAIIEQGMISRVIEARPEEVRAFLEEAAGITRYKERRRETESRLSDARDNLVRLEDVRAGLAEQLRRLSAEAEVAQRYQTLHSELLSAQGLLWVSKQAAAQTAQQAAVAEITVQTEALAVNQSALQHSEQQCVLLRETATRANEAVNVAQGEVFAMATERSRVEAELKAQNQSRQGLQQRAQEAQQGLDTWHVRQRALQAERTRLVTELEQLQAGLAAAHRTWQSGVAQPELMQTALRAARHCLDQVRQQLAQQQGAERVALTGQQAAARALSQLAERQVRLTHEVASLNEPPAETVQAAEFAQQQAAAQLVRQQATLQNLQTALQQAEGVTRAARSAQQVAQQTLTQLQARHDALAALQARLRDPAELAAWLSKAGLADYAPWWQQVRVAAGWELAVEAVLRERLAARGPIAAEALQAAAWQAPVPASTAVVLAAPSASPTLPEGAVWPATQTLRSLIETDDADLAARLDVWLAGVFAVADASIWQNLLAKHATLAAGLSFVMQTGQCLRQGELHFFAPDVRTHGALERQRELQDLAFQRQVASAAQQQCASELQAAEAAQQAAQQALQTARAALQTAQNAQHTAQLQWVQASEQLKRWQARSEALQAELHQTAQAVAQETQQQDASTAALVAAQTAVQVLVADENAAKIVLHEAESAHQQAQSTTTTHQQQHQAAQFAVRQSEAQQQDVLRNLGLADAECARLLAQTQQFAEALAALDDAALLAALQTALQLHSAREQTLAACRDALADIQQRLSAADSARHALNQAQHAPREALAAARLALQAAELALTQAAERLAELPPAVCAVSAEQVAQVKELSLTRDINRLQRDIHALGPVNLVALETLQREGERQTFLAAQYEDLTAAVETLVTAIQKIDRETRSQLNATFETVNRHFAELFPQLFGGGEAALVLTGEDLLAAGVQIVARPPGKKNTSIHLLSGGEKALTAIALVFAMFQLNPAPFCMLDEVDAPLDDSNTERYCEMVKRMSAITQFVFITHSKITMERAQQLVGVTMQEQGVSRVVEVDIQAALQLAEQQAAAPQK